MEYLIFDLAEEMFGIPVNQVREIMQLPGIHSIPNAPDFIEGVITLRGHSVAVMDLRKRFGLPTQVKNPSRHVIVVRLKPMILSLLVDRVHNVLEVSSAQIDSSADVINGYLAGEMVAGIAHAGDKVVILLDLAKVLNPQEQKEMKSIGTEAHKQT